MSEPMPAVGQSEFGRGWKIIVAGAVGVGLGLSPIPIYTIGVFTKPLAAEFGWARGEIQAVLLFLTMGALIGSPMIGHLMDKVGVRKVTLWSIVGFAVGLALIGLVTTALPTLYALGFLMGLVGAGTTPLTWSRAIFDWFVARRGLALGLALTGTGMAAAVLPAYATWLVDVAGWRMGYVGLAILPGLIALPLTYFWLKPSPTPTSGPGAALGGESGLTYRQALGSYRFWVMTISFFLAGLGTGGVVTHFVPMLTDHGYSAADAAKVAGIQGLAVVLGRAATGYFLDRIWAPALVTAVFVLPAGACLFLATGVSNLPMSTVAVALVGFAGGAEFDMIAFLTARYFGLKHFGAIYGTAYSIFVSASGLAPPVFGWAYDRTGSYDVILQVAAACFVVGALLILTMRAYPKSFAPQVGDAA